MAFKEEPTEVSKSCPSPQGCGHSLRVVAVTILQKMNPSSEGWDPSRVRIWMLVKQMYHYIYPVLKKILIFLRQPENLEQFLIFFLFHSLLPPFIPSNLK